MFWEEPWGGVEGQGEGGAVTHPELWQVWGDTNHPPVSPQTLTQKSNVRWGNWRTFIISLQSR